MVFSSIFTTMSKKIEYESIKLHKKTVHLLREIKRVTGVPAITFADIAIVYKALDMPQEAKDKIKNFLDLISTENK